ncbi:MAG: peptide MFS transporter [Proteobacteria bacterium]|nr:peptide MFS transporter [Pseudomonadota bacterium]
MNVVVLIGLIVTLATCIPVFLQLRKHPRGLWVLFFAEMWERFSYYGMRTILIFYLTQHFLFDDDFAASQYGAYTALVYLLPLIGGMLADRYIGARKAVTFGALLLVAGHFLMAAEGAPARQFLIYAGQSYEVQVSGRADDREAMLLVDGQAYRFSATDDGGLRIDNLPLDAVLPPVLAAGSYDTIEERDPFFVGIFYLALALIIMGVGFLKANISAMVGKLYRQGDPRRDPGFTLYYYGINLGAFWATILCGLLGQTIGWWAGFGLAGVGMLAGLIVFVRGKAWLDGHGEPPNPEKLRRKILGPLTGEHSVYLGSLLGVGVVWVLVQRFEAVGYMLSVASIVVLGYLAWFLIAKCSKIERERMMLALVLIFGAVVFFTLFEQAGSSLNLFADRNTSLPDQGFWTMTAAQAQSFNPGFILIFAPVFAALWVWLGRRGFDPSPLVKFGLGLVQLGLGFLVLVWGAGYADENAQLPLFFLGLAYLFHTTGELCLSPVGLSQMTKLSVTAFVSTMMAIWFMGASWAQYVASFIAQMAGTETVGGQVLDPEASLATSLGVFHMIGWIGIGFGIVFFALSPLLKHWAHGVNDSIGQQPSGGPPLGRAERPTPDKS